MKRDDDKQEEIVEAEVVEDLQETKQSLQLASDFSVPKAVKQWKDYQRLTKDLLDESDYQAVGRNKFKKKSAWRKYSRAFNLTETEKEVTVPERDSKFWPLYASAWSSIASPDGRTGTGYHECNIFEKCCPASDGLDCTNDSQWHVHCETSCNGHRHWGHPGDIPATAHTRAKNRAISDWVGAGEVSAEEINIEQKQSKKEEKYPPCPSCGKETIIKGKKDFGGGFLCWKNHPNKGCGTKFKTLDDIKNPDGERIAKLVENICKGEKEFKKIDKEDEYKKILDEFKIDYAEDITDEKTANKVLLRLSTQIELLKIEAKK